MIKKIILLIELIGAIFMGLILGVVFSIALYISIFKLFIKERKLNKV